MKAWPLLLLVVACPLTAAEIRVIADAPTAVFGGATRWVPVKFHNRSNQTVTEEMRIQMLQASSATAAPTGASAPWKRLTLLSRQTILEQAAVELPVVRGPTRFLLRISNPETLLGVVEVWAYPSNLLAELGTLLDGQPLLLSGVDESWKTLLTAAGVRTQGFAEVVSSERFSKLAILGPIAKSAEDFALAHAVSLLANEGAGVIWIKSAPTPDGMTEPSYALLKARRTAVVVAQDYTLTNLATDPWAQARLVRMARIATGHDLSAMPNLTN